MAKSEREKITVSHFPFLIKFVEWEKRKGNNFDFYPSKLDILPHILNIEGKCKTILQ